MVRTFVAISRSSVLISRTIVIRRIRGRVGLEAVPGPHRDESTTSMVVGVEGRGVRRSVAGVAVVSSGVLVVLMRQLVGVMVALLLLDIVEVAYAW